MNLDYSYKMKPALHLKIHQSLAMTPQLQQAIRLLQLSSLELEQEIQKMLEQNPLLESVETSEGMEELTDNSNFDNLDITDNKNPIEPKEERDPAKESELDIELDFKDDQEDAFKTEKFDLLDKYDQENDENDGKFDQADFEKSSKEDYESSNLHSSSLDPYKQSYQQKSSEFTLQEYLYWQMELLTLSEKEKLIAIALIDAISEEGYLIQSLAEIKESLGLDASENEIEQILTKIQQFEPIGIGARNLEECLNIQLHALPDKVSNHPYKNMSLIDKAKELLKHLDTLAKRDYTQLRLQLDLDESTLKAVVELVTSLNPRPGTKISSKKCEYIVPDIYIMKKNQQWIVELNRELIPNLRVNTGYAALIKRSDKHKGNHKGSQKNHPGDTVILQAQLKEAKWFIKSIRTRQATLLKVSRCIIQQQKDFLEKGEEYLKPLTLQQVASLVELHESTISRITTHKYALTPRGIFELKSFFSNTVENQYSATSIRALIKKLIRHESTRKPLSDQKLKTLLLERGINIARRTIAKYREMMHIPSSSQRKDGSNLSNTLL